jgi:hypothetical protein
MLLAQTHTAFFPPWYFWLFVFAVVVIVVGGMVSMIVSIKRTELALRIRERELAAHLMEVMLREQHLSPAEIEQVLNSYWRLGSFWGRFHQLWNTAKASSIDFSPLKGLPA